MEYYITQPKDYWIAPNAVNITLNARGEKNRVYASVASGAVIMCFVDSIKAEGTPGGEQGNGDGLWYGANHEPRRWPLTISPTYFNSDTRKYVYVAIPRSAAVGTQAIVVFPSEQLDIYGRVQRESVQDGSPVLFYEQVGSSDYFYVWLQGIIGAADAVTPGRREWEDPITDREWGLLETAQGRDEQSGNGEWYSWSPVSQTVTFLKKIVMSPASWFANLIVGTGKTQGNLTGIAKQGITTEENGWNSHIVTPSYLDEFGNTRYLRKDIDDVAEGNIGFLNGLWIGIKDKYYITKQGIASLYQLFADSIITRFIQVEDMKSANYTGDGIADTGWRLSNSHNGHSKLTIDELYVRMKAVFESLEVRERTYTGGDQIWSCAGNYVSRTDYLKNNGTSYYVDEEGVPYTTPVDEDDADGQAAARQTAKEITEDGGPELYNVPVAGEPVGYSTVEVPWMLRGLSMVLGKSNGLVSGLYSRYAKVRIVIPDETPAASRGGDRSATPAINQIRRVRCYFLAKDDDREIHNWWRINDLARCQTMNLSNTSRQTYISGRQTKAGNVFWWRKVIGVSKDPVLLDDGKWYHYFDVAFNLAEEESGSGASATYALEGSDIPAATDSVVQFGNTIITGRMNLMMMEVNGGDSIDYPNHSDAPCLKAYRGIYSFDLNKCWYGGNHGCCKMKLSPTSGYEFYGPNFKQVTEYDVVQVPTERGLWTDICRDKDAQGAYTNHWTFHTDDYPRTSETHYSDDTTTGRDLIYDNFVNHETHAVSAGAPVRKCYYYEKVSHKGCYWLCSIVDGMHWMKPVTEGGVTVWQKITDGEWAALDPEEQGLCEHRQNYTIDEPSETSQDWTLMVARGTMGETPAMLFTETVHGTTPERPDSSIYTANRYMSAAVTEALASGDDSSDDGSDDSSEDDLEWSKFAPNRRPGYDVWMSQNTILTVDSSNYLLKEEFWSQPTRISGDQGEPGADADDREWIYKGLSTYPFSGSQPSSIVHGTIPDPDYDPEHPSQEHPTPRMASDDKTKADWVPNGWQDTAIATDDSTNKFVYASWRDKPSGGSWHDFNTPILWSNWGVQGIDGDGVQYIYKLFANKLTAVQEESEVPTTALLDDTTKEWTPHPEILLRTLTSVSADTDIAIDTLADGRTLMFFTPVSNPAGIIIEKHAGDADDSELEDIDWRYVAQSDLPLTLDDDYPYIRIPEAMASFIIAAELASGEIVPTTGKNSGWSDDPLTPTMEMPYCYCSVIKKLDGDWRKNGIFGIFEKLGLWSRFSKDGQGAFKSTVFCRSNTTPNTPSNAAQTGYNTYNNPIPPVGSDNITWTDGIPAGEAKIWASSRIFTTDGQSPQQSVWTTPQPMSDTATYDVEFAKKQTGDATPAAPCDDDLEAVPPVYGNRHGGSGTQIWFDPTLDSSEDFTQMYWRAERECKNGAWGDWTVIRIKGEKGDQGDGQPEYTQTQEAWSNDETTTDVYTSPTTDYNAAAGQPGSAGNPKDADWSATTPANNNDYAYLWRRSRKMVLQDNGTYLPEKDEHGVLTDDGKWSYARLNGTNGTSIHTKGTIIAAAAGSVTLPMTGVSSGDLGIKQGDPTIWTFNGTTWTDTGGTESQDGDSYTVTKYCMVDLEQDGSAINVQGHLIMWSDEANSGNGAWIDLGEFKGDPGTTYYTHIAWASAVTKGTTPSGHTTTGQTTIPNATAVTGFSIAPFTGAAWMGVLVNTVSGDDSPDSLSYTWNKVEGPQGPQGGRTATVYLYKRSTTAISTVGIASTLYYKFSTKKLYTDAACTTEATTQLNGWSLTIPAGTDPIYVTAAIAYSETESDDIGSNEWVTPALFTGEHGINSATVFLYKRAASAPTGTAASPQQTLYYNFADGKLYTTSALTTEATTELNGWSLAMPATNGTPCYVIQAAALSTENHDPIATTDWSSVRKMLEDGKGQPDYIQTQEAWSDVESVVSDTTEPTPNGGWSDTTPANTNNYAYLWRRSRKMVLQSNGTYAAATGTDGQWKYTRLSGTNGTSISVKGTVATVADLNNISNPQDGDAYVVSANGHLYMWSSEAGAWVDLGEFKGDPGTTYYTHIAWASAVTKGTTPSGHTTTGQTTTPNATSVTGFSVSPFTGSAWMGVLIDTVASDSNDALSYTWNEVKGPQGDPGDDGWSCVAEPDNVFIVQHYDNEVSFDPVTVEFKVMKGSRNVTAFTLAAPTGKTLSDLSTEFYAAQKGSSGDDAKKVQVTQPKTHTVGNVTTYYTKGSFTINVVATDPDDNTQTQTFTITVACFAQLMGEITTKIKGDVETTVAKSLTYAVDGTDPSTVNSFDHVGTYIRSSKEKTDSVAETVTTLTTANPANIFGFTKGVKFLNSTWPVLPFIQDYGIEVNAQYGGAIKGRIQNLGFNGIEDNYVLTCEVLASQVVAGERFHFELCDQIPSRIISGLNADKLYVPSTTEWTKMSAVYTITRATVQNFDTLVSDAYNGFFDVRSTASGTSTHIYIRKLQIERGSVPSSFGICNEDNMYAANNDHECAKTTGNVELDNTDKWGSNPASGDRFAATGGTWNGMAIYANSAPLTDSNGTPDGNYRIMELSAGSLQIAANTPYTLSFWAKASSSGAKMRSYLVCSNAGGNANEESSAMEYRQTASTAADGLTKITLDTAWRKYYVHFYAQRDYNSTYAVGIRISTADSLPSNCIFSVCGMRLEKGYITSYNRTDYKTVVSQTARAIDMSVLVNSVKKAGIELTTNQNGDVTEGVIMLTADKTIVSGDFYVPRVISETDKMITTIEAGQIIIRSKTTQSYGLFEINGNGEIILSMYDQNGNCVVNLGGTPNTLINGEWVNWKLCSKETGHTSDGKTYYAVSESQCTNYYQLKLGQVINTNSTIEYYLPPVTGATEGTQTTDSVVIARNNMMFSNQITAVTVQALVNAIKSATSFIANGYYVVPNDGRFEVEANQYGPTNYKVNLYHFVNGVLSEIITQRFSYA